MKILMVAIPNHHFFQWVNQLKDSGYEVFWFDVTDGGPKSDKIAWVTQIKGWKLRWDFPFRTTIKKIFPKLYALIQKLNERSVTSVFNKILIDIKPDIVHCFEMQLSGLPILSIMEINMLPFIYSSWGSDVFYYDKLGVSKQQLQRFYNRVNYAITDCKRDYNLMVENSFNSKFLGVFPGNGGLTINQNNIQLISKRNIILIKGYDDGVGKASVVLKAFELLPKSFLEAYKLIVYSADNSVERHINNSSFFSDLDIEIYYRYAFLQNESLLKMMGESCIHIANSISDGMPNVLLEAMGMGAFPIQSNPGNVTEEVITHGKNGYLIHNALDEIEISNLIKEALANETLRKYAQNYNVNFIDQHYNRTILQPKIITLYESVLIESNK
ncbi:glycosyltransferase [Mariniflexile gromovii]|uniref:Glycosyltransferase n=1 Tax=Mariniflexile gromovii TaxID=362523 RepID=A0ABS4BWX6_9FLAO|nr:glycosyltransferase [Mariniflexile gromovii]MBP0904527.1 glycosyltransferase [Mariniflexile gromovii]